MTAPPSFRPDDGPPLEPEMSAEELAAARAASEVTHELADDDGAEHRAYLRGVEVGHTRGLAEGRGAVCALLRSILARTPERIAHRIVAELLATIEADGAADPAGVERARAAGIAEERANTAALLEEHAAKFIRAAREAVGHEMRTRCEAKASELRTMAAYIQRGDRAEQRGGEGR